MKLTTDENGLVILKEVYTGIKLISENEEEFIICMRDGGFEFKYQGKSFEAKNNKIHEFNDRNAHEKNIPPPPQPPPCRIIKEGKEPPAPKGVHNKNF